MSFTKGKNREEKIDTFLDLVAWWHSEKETPTGLYATIGRVEKHLETLNVNIQDANKSSTHLTRALNKITLFGATIAGIGVLVALLSLILEIYKYMLS